MVSIENASPDKTAMIKEDYVKANPTATPSAFDWWYIERLALAAENFAVIVLVLALTFIGLYIGSQLNKPAKT